MSSRPPRVFISYTHDSHEHIERVLGLSERLRHDGIDARLDQYEESQSPEEGWPRWSMDEIEHADFVLVVCTEVYFQRFRGRAPKGQGLGGIWEGGAITLELYENQGRNHKFIPVVWTEEDCAFIPKPLRHWNSYLISNDIEYNKLYLKLTKKSLAYRSDLSRVNIPLDSCKSEGGEYANKETESTNRELEELYARKERAAIAGHDTRSLDVRILEIRRMLRKGPQLRGGEHLLDGRYRLTKVIGSGGFATVWRAYDRKLKKVVALKILHGQHSDNRDKRDRFFRGAHKMAELSHQHIVQVIERRSEDEGWYFFVMECISGTNLEEAVLDGQLDRNSKINIIAKIALALEYAHRHGVIHRDVKPSNILLDQRLEPKLTDFDLVLAEDVTRFTGTGSILGSMPYLAPEALRSAKSVGPTADIYSLGSSLVFALYGKPLPFGYYNNPDSVIAVLEISDRLKRILRRATAVDHNRRHRSAVDFSNDLKKEAAGERSSEDLVRSRWAGRVLFFDIKAIWSIHARKLLYLIAFLVLATINSYIYVQTQTESPTKGPNIQSQLLLPDGFRMATGNGPSIRLPTGADSYYLSLSVIDAPAYTDYRLDIVDPANPDSAPLWSDVGLERRHDDTFDLLLPRTFFSVRKIELRLYGLENKGETLLASYTLEL